MNGRKRHILVDTQGLLLEVKVHPANDRDGAKLLLAPLRGTYPRLDLIWGDNGYRGKLVDWVAENTEVTLEIVELPWRGLILTPEGTITYAPKPKGFVLLPRRWVVERTFAWLGRCRRLSKSYEYLPEAEESFIYAAMIRLMLRRLAS